LARSPNKQQLKNEVKYKIPEKWTGKFYKYDVLPINMFKVESIRDERGKINKIKVLDNNIENGN